MLCVSKNAIFSANPSIDSSHCWQGWRAQYVKMMEMTWAQNPAARPTMADMARGIEALCNQDPSAPLIGEFM